MPDDFEENDEIVHPRLTGNDDDIAASSDDAGVPGRDDNGYDGDYEKDYNGNSGRISRKSLETSSKDGEDPCDPDDKESSSDDLKREKF